MAYMRITEFWSYKTGCYLRLCVHTDAISNPTTNFEIFFSWVFKLSQNMNAVPE